MSRDLHQKPFDEATLAKLRLFSGYLKEWLPTFISGRRPTCDRVHIFDFFSGPGRDVLGKSGSPTLILDIVDEFCEKFSQVPVELRFNERNRKKFALLKSTLGNRMLPNCVEARATMQEFTDAFDESRASLRDPSAAKLVFLDQNGIKHITTELFRELISFPLTDFLFFFASSSVHRFAETPEFKAYFDTHKINLENFVDVHRAVIEYFRDLLPSGQDYYVAGFSLKKGSNIYGLIFGSGHLIALDKFLRTAWKEDPERGEANFDIDADNLDQVQPSLFRELNIPKKLELFEAEVSKQILAEEIVTDRELWIFALTNGFLGSHAKAVLREMKKLKRVERGDHRLSKSCLNEERAIVLATN